MTHFNNINLMDGNVMKQEPSEVSRVNGIPSPTEDHRFSMGGVDESTTAYSSSSSKDGGYIQYDVSKLERAISDKNLTRSSSNIPTSPASPKELPNHNHSDAANNISSAESVIDAHKNNPFIESSPMEAIPAMPQFSFVSSFDGNNSPDRLDIDFSDLQAEEQAMDSEFTSLIAMDCMATDYSYVAEDYNKRPNQPLPNIYKGFIRKDSAASTKKPDAYDPNRIPASVFSNKTQNHMEWSVASNESTFSIQIGHNANVSKDNVKERIPGGIASSPARVLSAVKEGDMEYKKLAVAGASPTLKDKLAELDETQQGRIHHVKSISRSSNASTTSIRSFAFPILTEDGHAKELPYSRVKQKSQKRWYSPMCCICPFY